MVSLIIRPLLPWEMIFGYQLGRTLTGPQETVIHGASLPLSLTPLVSVVC